MLLCIHLYFNTPKQRTLQHTSVDHMEMYMLQHHALGYNVPCHNKTLQYRPYITHIC